MNDRPSKTYEYTGNRRASPPDYARVARVLSDAELEEEIAEERGSAEYRLALVRELDRRADDGPPLP